MKCPDCRSAQTRKLSTCTDLGYTRFCCRGCRRTFNEAQAAWAALAEKAKGVYLSDITVGEHPQLRGHWLDRLPAIEQDMAALASKLAQSKPADAQPHVATAIREILGRPESRAASCRHVPPPRFQPGGAREPRTVSRKRSRFCLPVYRHVNQAERYNAVVMQAHEKQFRATIPAAYTNSPYPLEYDFEVKETPERAWLYPGFSVDRTNQPYFLVREA